VRPPVDAAQAVIAGRVRALALAIIRRGDELLVFEVPDPVRKVTGFRPPGGSIEFGETGAAAVVREIREELGLEIVDPRYLGTVENIYEWLGRPGHEIVLLYAARFADATAYGRDTCYIAVHVSRGMEFESYFRAVERIMDDYEGRPHWGKRHYQTAATLAGRYPEWERFQAVRARLDPNGVFVNDYVERVLGPVRTPVAA